HRIPSAGPLFSEAAVSAVAAGQAEQGSSITTSGWRPNSLGCSKRPEDPENRLQLFRLNISHGPGSLALETTPRSLDVASAALEVSLASFPFALAEVLAGFVWTVPSLPPDAQT